jgi:signal peptidase I
MIPTFRPGEAVLARRRGRHERPRRGQIVVCRLPEGIPGPPGLLIKRVVAVAGQPVPGGEEIVPPGHVYLCGDGPRSYDSRSFGPLPTGSVVGRVIARLYVTPSSG